jgi:site-specific recombinase XerD
MTFDFLEVYLPDQVGRSPHTIESLRDTLTIFRRFVQNKLGLGLNDFTFDMCDRNCLFNFLDYLKELGNSPSTRNHRLAGLKTYLSYASDVDIALQSVSLRATSVPPAKAPKREKEILSVDDCSCIFRQPPQTRRGLRDRTFMILLFETACRVSELLSLKTPSLHLQGEKPFIHVLGKGNKERYIALTEVTAAHLRQYLSIFHGKDSPNTDFVFYTIIKDMANVMTARNVEGFIDKYADMARKERSLIPDKVYPHMFRRSKATALYQKGTPLPLVSSFLGHAQLETTRIYARPSMDMLRTAIESVETPEQKLEKPLWKGREEELAKKYGLR